MLAMACFHGYAGPDKTTQTSHFLRGTAEYYFGQGGCVVGCEECV